MEISRKRHILKAISWRLVGSITTFFVALYLTGDINIGITFGLSDTALKILLYYLHERIWYRTKFGIK